MMNIIKIKKNRACSTKLQRSRGFVILYAVMLSSIILAITLGVLNISLQEIKFGTSTRNTNDAFFAADTGAECALYYDKTDPANNAFTGTATVNCSGSPIELLGSFPVWNFVVPGLGNEEQGCAKVTVDKSSPPTTVITSKGYNNGNALCLSSSLDRVERELQVTYTNGSDNPILVASPSIVGPGDIVTVAFDGIQNPVPKDWIGRYLVSAEDESIGENDWVYDSGSPDCSQEPAEEGVSSGSCAFVMPDVLGDYNFRLFADEDLDLIATSNTVTVDSSTPPPVVNYNLTVNLVGSGVVRSIPSGIDCGSTCQTSFPDGTTVALTADPNEGSIFNGWTGNCSGIGDCNLTMDADKTATATFGVASQIAFIGANSAGGTSIAIPAHQSGDFIVMFAYRDGNNTAPLLPSGWTTIGLASGANSNSSRLAYRVASSSGTTSGTWTYATELVVQVYRGQSSSTPFGAQGSTGGLGTSVSYPEISLNKTNGTSWVAGFAGHRSTNTTIEIAPSGMINRTSIINLGEVVGHDTGGGVSSWNVQNVSVGGTSSGWRARTLEIISK
jgi:hypothetical protein